MQATLYPYMLCTSLKQHNNNNLRDDNIVDTKSGMATCQELCHNHMCCVVEEEEGEYSCKDDVTMDCAVYAGCVALIDDNFW